MYGCVAGAQRKEGGPLDKHRLQTRDSRQRQYMPRRGLQVCTGEQMGSPGDPKLLGQEVGGGWERKRE